MTSKMSRGSTFDVGSHFNTMTSPKGYRNSDSSYYIRAEFERDYQQKLQQLRNIYEMRVQALSESIKDAFRLVQNDDLVQTMREDVTSQEFVNQRVKEIIEECLNNEKEDLIDKLSRENADFRGEFSKLEHENARLVSQQENIVEEANRKIEEFELRWRESSRGAELSAEEVTNLKRTIQNLERDYEEALKKKDEQVIARTEKDLGEIQKIKERTRDLEIKLKESENKCWELTQELTVSQKEVDRQRERSRQLEVDVNTLNSEISEICGREETTRRKVIENEESHKGLRSRIEDLNKEIDRLRSEIDMSEQGKKDLEQSFSKKTQDFENIMQKEHSKYQDDLEKVQKKYKEKIEKYKRKILECKDRIADKEKEMREVTRKSDETNVLQEKNLEIIQLKMQEQRDSYENKLLQAEEESNQKLSDLQIRYDEQLKELQVQFQKVLDQKIEQIHDDTQEQISHIREQERELQEILEEKIVQMERDYIKVAQHDEIMQEKNKLVERLKQELSNKDHDHKQEISSKLRNLENRLRDEAEEAERAFKGMVREFENKINGVEIEKRKIKEELEDKVEESGHLKRTITELETQKKKLFETIEEWGTKSKKLKEVCENEQHKRLEMEKNVREQQENYGEIRKLLDDTKREIQDRDSLISHLNQEIANLENGLDGQQKQHIGLEKEYEEMKREYLRREQNKDKSNRELEDEKGFLIEEEKRLHNKIVEVERLAEERYALEARDHTETRTKLKYSEERVRLLNVELKENEVKIQKLRQFTEELEKDNNKLKLKLSESENHVFEKERENADIQRMASRSRVINEQFRRNLEALVADKVRALRSELRGVGTDCLNIINALKRDNELKVEGLLTRFKRVLERTAEHHENEKESLHERLDKEFTYEIGNLKREYESVNKDLCESYEKKVADKERSLDILAEKYENLKERTENVEREHRSEKDKRINLEDQVDRQKKEINERKKEREASEKKSEEIQNRLTDEINNVNKEARRAREEFFDEKRELDIRHTEEINDLVEQIEAIKEKSRQNMVLYEERIKDLGARQVEELSKANTEHDEEKYRFNQEIRRLQDIEKVLREEIIALKEELDGLDRSCIELERHKKDIANAYERRIEEFEVSLDEANSIIKREAYKNEELKIEKMNEGKKHRKTIQGLEDELRQRSDRISSLLEERNRFLEVIREQKRQIEFKDEAMDRQKHDVASRTTQQTKEIEQLHKLLTKSYKTVNQSLERSIDREPEIDVNGSIEELKRLEKYLEKRSPNKGQFASSYRNIERSPTRDMIGSGYKSLRDKVSWPSQSKY